VEIDTWMPHFGDLLAQGLTEQTNKVRTAATQVASALATGANPTINTTVNAAPFTGGGASGQHQQVISLLTQMVQSLAQIHGAIQQQGGGGGTSLTMNNTLPTQGITNAQQFYNFLQSLGGYGFQDLQGGAYGMG
jgi:hypothetical protein